MFLRSTERKKDGKTHRYFSVVENRRCPSSPHRQSAAHRWSPPTQSPIADSPVSYPGCNRAWPSGSAASLLRSTYCSPAVHLRTPPTLRQTTAFHRLPAHLPSP